MHWLRNLVVRYTILQEVEAGLRCGYRGDELHALGGARLYLGTGRDDRRS